jgi:hypothetical protein
MLKADKQVLLSGFLGQLPSAAMARLAKAVEVDRLTGGTGLPHDEILRALRPALRQSHQVQRTPTPQRFFCRPFEDLLAPPGRQTKQKGRIARSSIVPVWNWLADELMPERHRQLTETIRDAIVDYRDGDKSVAELWSEAAVALKTALADEKSKAAAARKLGDRAAVEDAVEMALLLGGANEVAELQRLLPKPVHALGEDDIGFVRDMYDRLSKTDPDLAPYMALVVMGRLERPWEALRLAAAISRRTTDTMIASTDMGVIGEILFNDLDMHVKKIQSARPMDFDAEVLLNALAGFAELSSGIVKELGIRRDGKWGHRLGKDRADVAQIIEGLIERAPKEIFAALPAPKVGGFNKGPKPLDVGRPPDPERVARAMRYARLIIHSRPFAAAAAFSAKLKEVTEETAAQLRTYSEDILREVRAAPPDDHSNVRQYIELMLDICTLVLGEEETDFLRRRARVQAA